MTSCKGQKANVGEEKHPRMIERRTNSCYSPTSACYHSVLIVRAWIISGCLNGEDMCILHGPMSMEKCINVCETHCYWRRNGIVKKRSKTSEVAQFLPGICVWTRVPMPICISKPSEGVSKCRETLGSGTRRARAMTQGWAFPSWSLRRPTVIA